MSTDDLAISVRNLTKTYRLFGHPGDRIKQFLSLGFRKYHQEFTALKDVSFDIKKGETVGIIGRNGSGKSTLLQLICGILKPTSGTVQVNGRVSALLELGAGFNPDFTGRENVYFQGAIMGLGKEEMDERFDDIAAFADIGEFIDQPVRIYSSGMFVRLAFAVAVSVNPEILVVDEALSVGDESFQRKCFTKIHKLREIGCTVIIVSHILQIAIELCDICLLMEKGELLVTGISKKVVEDYQRIAHTKEKDREKMKQKICQISDCDFKNDMIIKNIEYYEPKLIPKSTIFYEKKGAEIVEPNILSLAGTEVNVLRRGTVYIYKYSAVFDIDVMNPRFGMMIKTINGYEIAGLMTRPNKDSISIKKGEIIDISFYWKCNLQPGTYFMNSGILGGADNCTNYLHRILDILMFKVFSEEEGFATAIIDLAVPPFFNLIRTQQKNS